MVHTLPVAFVGARIQSVGQSQLPTTAANVGVDGAPLFWLADEPASPAVVFEPVLPSETALIGMVSVVALCVVAAVVWNNGVVPVSRTKLALSKSRGQVKEYLDEIRDNPDKELEQWLLTDWIRQEQPKKPPAVPFLRKAKWNSGDNPVVVTAALMMLGILVASVSERVF